MRSAAAPRRTAPVPERHSSPARDGGGRRVARQLRAPIRSLEHASLHPRPEMNALTRLFAAARACRPRAADRRGLQPVDAVSHRARSLERGPGRRASEQLELALGLSRRDATRGQLEAVGVGERRAHGRVSRRARRTRQGVMRARN
jgi:hypothetical protein